VVVNQVSRIKSLLLDKAEAERVLIEMQAEQDSYVKPKKSKREKKS